MSIGKFRTRVSEPAGINMFRYFLKLPYLKAKYEESKGPETRFEFNVTPCDPSCAWSLLPESIDMMFSGIPSEQILAYITWTIL